MHRVPIRSQHCVHDGDSIEEKDLLFCALRLITLVDIEYGSVVEGQLMQSDVEVYPLGRGRHRLLHVARVVRPSKSSRKVFVWH